MVLKVLLLCILISCAFTGILAGNGKSFSTKGIVEDVEDCGGQTPSFVLRVDNCTSTPCELIPDILHNISIDFVASSTVIRLVMRLWVIQSDGTETMVYESNVGGGGIEEGLSYTLNYQLTPNAVLRGEIFDLRLEFFEAISGVKEVCVEAPFTIV